MTLQKAAAARFLPVLLLACAWSQPAFAQNNTAVRGACRADIARLCPGVKQGARIVACIKRQRMLASAACDAALTKAGVR